MTVRVHGFDHAVLRVADVERSLAWYTEMLGLAAERMDEWRNGEILFPSVRIDATTVLDLLQSERTGENVDHLCLVIDPVDFDVLEASGEFDVAARLDGLYGAQGFAESVYVRDPDGNLVELRSY